MIELMTNHLSFPACLHACQQLGEGFKIYIVCPEVNSVYFPMNLSTTLPRELLSQCDVVVALRRCLHVQIRWRRVVLDEAHNIKVSQLRPNANGTRMFRLTEWWGWLAGEPRA